jgi:hypothetical protein
MRSHRNRVARNAEDDAPLAAAAAAAATADRSIFPEV